MTYVYLFCAIIAEVIATSALKAADGFTNLVPSIIVAVGYAAAFYFLSLTLRTLPIGIAYAIWSGLGIEDKTRSWFRPAWKSSHIAVPSRPAFP